MSEDSTSPSFRRAVSRWEIVGLSLNDVIGSGVYLLPAAAAALLGPWSVGAVVLAGFAVLLLVLCFAEAASYFDQPGSAYLYARTAFGDLVGFEVGWMTWLARVASVASLSVGFAQALSYLVPAVGSGIGRQLAITLPLVLLTVINIVGVKSGARTAVCLAVAKIVPLLVFIGVGLFYANPSLVFGAEAPTEDFNKKMGEAALLLLFAYAGFENTAAPAGEFKNPRRDVPFALLTQIGIVTFIYVAVMWVAQGILPHDGLVVSKAPLAAAAELFLGSPGGWLLTVGAVVSILGTNSNTVLAGPRYLYALAADGFGPRALARLHPKFRTPADAILLQMAVALPLAWGGTFIGLAALSVIARLATYLGTAAAIPVLRRKFPNAEGVVRLPGGVLIPAGAIILCVGLAASAGENNLKAAALALNVGLIIYALRREPGGSASEQA